MKVLVAAGFIKPRWELGAYGGRDGYAASDLAGFLDRLAKSAKRSRSADPEFVTIPIAARRARCSAADVVRLILDGKLSKQIWPGKRSYLKFLVDLTEVRKALNRPALGGIKLRQATREIGTAGNVLDALIRHGHIEAITIVNPVNKYRQKVVLPAEIARFKATYVSLFDLAKQRGTSAMAMRAELERAGVMPVFDPAAIGSRFYRRAP